MTDLNGSNSDMSVLTGNPREIKSYLVFAHISTPAGPTIILNVSELSNNSQLSV